MIDRGRTVLGDVSLLLPSAHTCPQEVLQKSGNNRLREPRVFVYDYVRI